MNHSSSWLLLLAAPLAVGCDSGGGAALPTAPPTEVTKVVASGFTSPTDAVASLDGSELYFAAFTAEDGQGAVFRASASAGASAELWATGPLAMPIGLVLSCDGDTLYVADAGAADAAGGVYALSPKGGALDELAVTGVGRVGGLAMGPDCETLFITGRTEDGAPALYSVPRAGGAASLVYSGAPLAAPTGLHVDQDGVSWVMDHQAVGANGLGVLFAIPRDGSEAREVVSDLRMGTPGGVSLTAGGGTAVMPTRDRDGNAQLTSVNIATGEVAQLPVPDLVDPAGLRTARQAGVFAIVDSEGGAIFRAQ